MKLRITTLVTIKYNPVEGVFVENIFHSLEDNQDKAYQELIDQVNATYGDGGVLQFKNIKGNENPTTNPSNPIYLVIINPQG